VNAVALDKLQPHILNLISRQDEDCLSYKEQYKLSLPYSCETRDFPFLTLSLFLSVSLFVI
jgi:hypothetical protein